MSELPFCKALVRGHIGLCIGFLFAASVLTPSVHAQSSISVHVNAGWNLLSLPISAPNPQKTVLFPTATSFAFTYDNAYVLADSLESGTGFWLKFDEAGTVLLDGAMVYGDTITLKAGWNIIGGVSVPTAVADIRTVPPGNLSSGFFSYSALGGYLTADTLRPGLGYWVKAAGAGTMIVEDTTVTMIVEDFETGSKGAYAAANVTLNTGVWNLNDALIGSTAADVRDGNASVRIRNSGKVTMQFDITTGARFVTIQHAKYGTDGTTTWQLWYSVDYGNTWTQSGTTVSTTSKTFETAAFPINANGLIRLEIRKTDGTSARTNIDDIAIGTHGVQLLYPAPVLDSISPASDTVGAGDLTLHALGSHFVASSVISWNGKNLITSFIDSTELLTLIPSSYLTGTGTVQVGVYTPNGGLSATRDFVINPGVNGYVPVMKYISPQLCTFGRAGFTLTMTGLNFGSNSKVLWNDSVLATTYLSGTQLTAQVTGDLVADTGTVSVRVYTPPPAGGTSSSRTFSITTRPLVSTNIHLTMGNPSGAEPDTAYPLNYLIERGQYCLSYSRDRNLCNWVSWELDSTWFGSAPRGSFLTDNTLPAGWTRITTDDYSGTGFNRGHMCPSADRTLSVADNDTVFLMTNIIPQSGPQNGGPWGSFETACRDLAMQGDKLYIYSGGYGEGGVGDFGYATSIAGGKVAVPSKTWKVVMVLPPGTNDLARVTTSTRCIAVILDNNQGPFNDWTSYRVSVDSVEALTGYDFFPSVPVDVQAVIESVVDSQ